MTKKLPHAIETAETMSAPPFDPEFLERQYFRWINVCGPKGSGKTSLICALASHFCDHPIIRLDFSDFCAVDFERSLTYLRAKISELYLGLLETCEQGLRNPDCHERFIDAVEGTCAEKELSASLRELVHVITSAGYGDPDRKRPMILIDEVSRPLLFAHKYGFDAKMTAFFNDFLDIDHYELTGGIVTTSYVPSHSYVRFNLPHINDVSVGAIEPLARFCEARGIDLGIHAQSLASQDYRWRGGRDELLSCFESLEEQTGIPFDAELTTNWGPDTQTVALIQERRNQIAMQRERLAMRERERRAREAEEYAAALPDACPRLSKFMGVRELAMEAACTHSREKLNAILRDLYVRYAPNLSVDEVYGAIQCIDQSDTPALDVGETLRGLEEEARLSGCFRCQINAHDRHWGRLDLERCEHEPGYDDLSLIKVYLSPLEEKALGFFESLVSFLIREGSHRFHAKVARRARGDRICIWTARDDFFALEERLQSWDVALHTPLPFVAYRSKMGVSRELASWDSHNSTQTDLIVHYLKSINDASEIDVIEMYAQYVKAWNADLPEDHPLSTRFRRSDAQQLLLLLETLDVILGNASLADDCLLLGDNGRQWHALAHARNWHEAGERLLRLSCNGGTP